MHSFESDYWVQVYVNETAKFLVINIILCHIQYFVQIMSIIIMILADRDLTWCSVDKRVCLCVYVCGHIV